MGYYKSPMAPFFDSPDMVRSALSTQKYIVSDEISTILYIAQELGKPLLAEGPAGVGKTELAKTIAGAIGRPRPTLCDSTVSTSGT